MKRILCIISALILCASLMISCTDQTKNTDKNADQTTTQDGQNDQTPVVDPNAIYMGDYFDYDLSPFIQLPALSEIVVEKSLVDQLCELNTALSLSSLSSFSEVAANELTAKYDTVNIDFEGRPKDESVTLEDEVLQGMKAQGYEIMLGSGSFIGAYDHPTDDSLDTIGFEDQMIGMKVGETKDILVTFPDEYQQDVLEGMQVIFNVTVNSAKRPKPIDDATAQAQGYENAEAFNQEIIRLTKSQAAMEVVFRSAVITEYPVGDIELLYQYYIDSYLEYYYGSTLSDEEAAEIIESLKPDADLWAKEYARERIITKYLVDLQGIKITEQQLADYAEKQGEYYGVSGDTLIAYYGKDTIVYEYLYELAVEAVSSSVTFES